MIERYSRPGAALASASLALATLFLFAAGDAGLAAPVKRAAARQAAPVEQASPAGEAAPDKPAPEPKAAFTVLQGKPGEPAATGSTAKDGEESCFTARRKLWVDGEGWIVRRVTTCR
ncbi:MAG TPA: hypothetical protein VF744_04660 [Beijerinckiaceae bacterium]|jgi:hypothetical protein